MEALKTIKGLPRILSRDSVKHTLSSFAAYQTTLKSSNTTTYNTFKNVFCRRLDRVHLQTEKQPDRFSEGA